MKKMTLITMLTASVLSGCGGGLTDFEKCLKNARQNLVRAEEELALLSQEIRNGYRTVTNSSNNCVRWSYSSTGRSYCVEYERFTQRVPIDFTEWRRRQRALARNVELLREDAILDERVCEMKQRTLSGLS